MSAFTYPGVYIEELSSGVHTIAGVATSIAAFVGWAPQGPVTEATLVESWPEYQTLFGGLDSRSLLGYAVNQFFANGGQQAYIVRLVWDGSEPAAPGTNPALCTTAGATGVGYASTQIQASLGPIQSNAVTLYVGTPVLQSITIEPATVPPIPINAAPLQFTAKGIKSDGSPDSTLTPNWVSSDPTGVITISSSGQAKVVGPGTAVLTATDPSGLVSGSVTVTVVSATLTGINIVPNPVTLAGGETKQLAATGVYSDATTHDLTNTAAWNTTLAPSEATVDPATGLLAGGNAATAAAGTVKADWAGVSGSDAVNVVAPVLTSLVITPISPTIVKSQALTFTAVGIQSYNPPSPPAVPTPPLPVTLSGETWESSNPAVVTIDATGKITWQGAGSTTITVTSSPAQGSLKASTTLTIVADSVTLNSVAVTPANVSLAKGQLQQMKAIGTYSDGSAADLTASASWTSSGGDATVTPSGGLVTGQNVTATAVTITASWDGVNGTAAVTVTPAVLQSIAVTPPPVGTIPDAVTIPSASTKQFTATGNYSDTGTKDLTTTVTWMSSLPAATVVPTGPTGGLATAVAAGGSLTLFASNPGAWGNSLRVSVSLVPSDPTRFSLLVQQVDAKGQLHTLESFVNLSLSSTDPQYAVTVVDNDSSYITFIDPATNLPVVPTAAPSPTPVLVPVALSGGADGAVLVPASDGNFEVVLNPAGTGRIHLLDTLDIFNLLGVPGETNATTIQQLQTYCHVQRAFYIVDPPQAKKISDLISSGPVGSTAGSITGQYSNNSAYYFPWIQAPDPLAGNRPALYPPCGFVAGIYAATDASRGVWKAPAGIDASLTGNSGLQYVLTDPQNGQLNIQAVNCLREFKVYGDVVWGARTLQGNDHAGSEWKYVPIRRLALFLESSLYDGTQWVVFEPNDEPLWSQIRLNVGAFMQDLFLKGAFQGTTPQQAYFVKCDSSNNPQSSIDLGIVNILVGFAPLYPAEFVVIQIQQIAGQIS
jgi:Bacteriophage tail sheath protein